MQQHGETTSAPPAANNFSSSSHVRFVPPPSSARPLIIGHRGAARMAPENTLASFARAFEDGADGIEFDVRLASDGVPVCIHDATLERTAGIPAQISALTSSELSAINVGSWYNRRYPDMARSEYARERVPSLTQTFATFAADESKTFYIELKCDETESETLAAAVVACVRAHDSAARVVIESFTLEALAACKRIAPEIRTAALFERTLQDPFPTARKIIIRAERCGADEMALHHTLVNGRTVEAAHAAALPVVVWTVDAPRWINLALDLGLKAVITNHPAPLVAALQRIVVGSRQWTVGS